MNNQNYVFANVASKCMCPPNSHKDKYCGVAKGILSLQSKNLTNNNRPDVIQVTVYVVQ